MKLATGACKKWIFFAVDNFPPCIPVTIFPQYRDGQPEAARADFDWTRDAFLHQSSLRSCVKVEVAVLGFPS